MCCEFLQLWTLVVTFSSGISPTLFFPPTESQVRNYLRFDDFRPIRPWLTLFGDNLFGVYESILKDSECDQISMSRIFVLVREAKGDRQRFVEYAVRGLSRDRLPTRLMAVKLLARIGGQGECPPVVALLADDDFGIVWAAADTLAAIGGPREINAIDVFLVVQKKRLAPDLRKHIEDCRDSMEKRIRASRTAQK